MATSTATTQETKQASNGQSNLPTPVTTPKDEKADSLIRRYALFGTATGLIPTFGLDVAALTAIQVKMINDLADVYEYDVNEQLMRLTLTTGVTALATRLLTGLASNLTTAFSPLKFLVGGATQAALAGFLTAEVGKIYQARLSSGQNPADVSVGDIVSHVISQVQEGKFNPTKVGGWQGKFGYLLNNGK